jgi:cold shock CspA family protein
MVGTITKVKADRGFFFIAVLNGPDIFGHVKDLSPELEFSEQLEGQRVEFHAITTPKGERATAIRPAN